nr:redoxin domain-containing protein [Natrinema sp. CBA1119]
MTVETDAVQRFTRADSAYSHRAFINEHDLTFPLLSDSLAEVCEEYGVRYDIWEQHQNVSQRALFVIDDTQTVQYAWMTEDALVKPDLSEVQDAMKSVDVFDS